MPKGRPNTSTVSSKAISNAAPAGEPAEANSAETGLREPPFGVDDHEARRQWLWLLAYNTLQARAASGGKLDTRFAILLSDLLGVTPATSKGEAAGKGDGLGDLLHNLSVEEFADYKRQSEPF